VAPTAVPAGVVAVPGWYAPGEKVINLSEVYNHIGHAVIVQDFVYGVHRSQKGTYFVQFERLVYGAAPFAGFKVVIFNNYAEEWISLGQNPTMYKNRLVRVRGVVQVHSTYGIEILVNSPRVIQVVDQAAQKWQ
jgi:hypothetical protein